MPAVTLKLLTVDQVAAMYAVAPSTVRRWLRSGRLHHVKLTISQQGKVRIPEDAVAADMERLGIAEPTLPAATRRRCQDELRRCQEKLRPASPDPPRP